MNSSKNWKNEFDFTTMIPQVNLFSFVFLEEIEDTKKTFPNELTFSTVFVISKGHLKNLDWTRVTYFGAPEAKGQSNCK